MRSGAFDPGPPPPTCEACGAIKRPGAEVAHDPDCPTVQPPPPPPPQESFRERALRRAQELEQAKARQAEGASSLPPWMREGASLCPECGRSGGHEGWCTQGALLRGAPLAMRRGTLPSAFPCPLCEMEAPGHHEWCSVVVTRKAVAELVTATAALNRRVEALQALAVSILGDPAGEGP